MDGRAGKPFRRGERRERGAIHGSQGNNAILFFSLRESLRELSALSDFKTGSRWAIRFPRLSGEGAPRSILRPAYFFFTISTSI